MPYLFGEGGTVLVEGMKFDLPEVVESAQELIDALVARFGGDDVTFTPDPAHFESLAWSGSGPQAVKKFWANVAGFYDVVDQALEFSVGPLTVKTFLLGKTWCVYHKSFDLVRTSHDEPVAALDPTPVVCLYGPRSDDAEGSRYGLLDRETVSAAEELLAGELSHLGLELQKSEPLQDPQDPRRQLQVAFIRFPHGRYGMGRGPIRVRCVTPDGGEVKSGPSIKN